MRTALHLTHLSTLVVGSAAFSAGPTALLTPSSRIYTRALPLSAVPHDDGHRDHSRAFATLAARALTGAAVTLTVLTAPLNPAGGGVAHADEWGQETEAPTLFTGETVMICTKRGPLGACTEQTRRTVANDNDKAKAYFKDPSAEVKRKQERMLTSLDDDNEGNALIRKLRQQSADNKEKNDNDVLVKTLINDQGASFGPFSQQVVILNTDGRTFTLLQNPQAMRLKKAGYIEDKKFVVQPSKEVIDEALVGGENLGDKIKGFFGSDKGTEGADGDVASSEAAEASGSAAGEDGAAASGSEASADTAGKVEGESVAAGDASSSAATEDSAVPVSRDTASIETAGEATAESLDI